MKEWTKEFNPFNSWKLLAHLYRWKEIKRENPLPPPVLVTIDPTNVCNLNCIWCNSKYLRTKNKEELSSKTLNDLAKFLGNWDDGKFRLESVCIAGGGEPTNHKGLGKFINELTKNNVGVGIVTNGTNLDKHLPYLSQCSWIGVSMDAGSPEVYEKLKGKNLFNKVIGNIEKINKMSQKGLLGGVGQGHGVSYKYLLHPQNVGDVYNAAKIAKEIGCRNMHIRPFGNPWDRDLKTPFSYGDIEEFKEQLNRSRELENDYFRIFGVTHKFDGNFNKVNDFKKCYAIFMTADFLPPTSKKGLFNLGLCCDRRGDKRLTLEDLTDFNQVSDFWGSKEHWDMFDKIDPKNCPRCTYQPHNRIYEKAIMEDNLTYEYI
jgi:MoaA/NifB/PqqE/SkfB family radical SAM enzyme